MGYFINSKPLTVEQNETVVDDNASVLNFASGATVTNAGNGQVNITVTGSGAGVAIKQDGSTVVGAATTLDFKGGVTVAEEAGTIASITIPVGITVSNDGTPVDTSTTNLNFTNATVVASGLNTVSVTTPTGIIVEENGTVVDGAVTSMNFLNCDVSEVSAGNVTITAPTTAIKMENNGTTIVNSATAINVTGDATVTDGGSGVAVLNVDSAIGVEQNGTVVQSQAKTINFTNLSVSAEAGNVVNVTAPTIGVTSYNTRTGAVVSQTGDYSFSQISGSVVSAQMPALTGDVTSTAGSTSTTIASGVVTNAKLADTPQGTFKGNPTLSTGAVQDMDTATATSILDDFIGDTGTGGKKGLVPAPATGDGTSGKFLKADGTWSVPSGTGSGVTSFNTRTGAVVSQTGDYSFNQLSGTLGYFQFCGLVGDVTAAVGDNTTTIALGAVTNTKLAQAGANTYKGNATGATATVSDIATNTAFNRSFSTSATDLQMDGVAAVGTSNAIPRADHVHPSDTSKQNIISSPTENDFVAVDSSGQVFDSGLYFTQSPNSSSTTAVMSAAAIQSAISSGVTRSMILQGDWNASTNNPTLTAGTGTPGYAYYVSVAGTQSTPFGSSVTYAVGDLIYYTTDLVWARLTGEGISNQLPNANILIGSSGGIATAQPVSGDITITNAGVTTIGSNKVNNAKLATMSPNSYKGNATGSVANATDVATNTAFNQSFETDTANIKMDGAVSVGSLSTIPRADHVHPSDTSKQNIISSPTANDFVTVNSSGQVIDSGLSLTQFSTASGSNQIMSASAVQDAIAGGLDSAVILLGQWNASTNSPTLTAGTGTVGFTYYCSNQGTQTAPSGVSTTYYVGDWVYYFSGVWLRIPGTAFQSAFEATVSNIKMDGTASVGTLSTIPRADHVHPTDTTRQALISSPTANHFVWTNSSGQTIDAGLTFSNTPSTSATTVLSGSAVQTMINAYSIANAFIYQGNWDASTNSPQLSAGVGTTGSLFLVTIAGTQTLPSGIATAYYVGDIVYYANASWNRIPGQALASGKILLGNSSGVAAQVTMTGDTTLSNTGVSTIGANVVTNAKSAQMAAKTIKGNNIGATANANDLTVEQVNAMLQSTIAPVASNLTGTLNAAQMPALTGDVAMSAGTTTTTIGTNAVTNAKLAQMASNTFKGNNTGATANALDLTATQATAMLNAFTGDSGSGGVKGLVPAPAAGNASLNYVLKADGTWGAPSAALSAIAATNLPSAGVVVKLVTGQVRVATQQLTEITPSGIFIQGGTSGNGLVFGIAPMYNGTILHAYWTTNGNRAYVAQYTLFPGKGYDAHIENVITPITSTGVVDIKRVISSALYHTISYGLVLNTTSVLCAVLNINSASTNVGTALNLTGYTQTLGCELNSSNQFVVFNGGASGLVAQVLSVNTGTSAVTLSGATQNIFVSRTASTPYDVCATGVSNYICFATYNGSNTISVVVSAYSGVSFSNGTAATITVTGCTHISLARVATNTLLLCWRESSTLVRVCTVTTNSSGTASVIGTTQQIAQQIDSTGATIPQASVKVNAINSNAGIVTIQNTSAINSTSYATFHQCNIDPNDGALSVSDAVPFNDNYIDNTNLTSTICPSYAVSGAGQQLPMFAYYSNITDRTPQYALQLGYGNMYPEGMIGVLRSSVSSGATATIDLLGQQATSVSLTSSKAYYVRNDGSITTNRSQVQIGTALSSTKLLLNA